MNESSELESLRNRIQTLEQENAMLRRDFASLSKGDTVKVPDAIKPLFDTAQNTVGDYFRNLTMDPRHGKIEISDQRYILVRASALSIDFLDTIRHLYADRGESEAMTIGKDFLFDIAHVIGINDARNFHQKMHLDDPIAKLSAGPVHFAYSGWATVDILPESSPTPDDNYYLIYHHPFSFEADSWIRAGKKSDTPVCVMNAGYSSGWCEESFGIPLTAVEVTCKAKGDENCTFIMSPPNRIQEHVNRFASGIATPGKKIVYDIPTFFERKKVEEEMQNARKKAEESDKAKTEFLANMSHEIRTPMNAIIGYVDLILQDSISTEHRSYLETVKDSGKLLLNLINDILDISKIEAGQLVIDYIPYSLRDLLDAMEQLTRGSIIKSKHDITLVKHYPVKAANQVFIDPTRVQQILHNLLSNAVKFTKVGKIEFGVDLSNDSTLEFYVKDSGIGIAESDYQKIFEMFGQADASTTREHGGTGLGLTISKKLVELMGGEIRVESSKGEGSKFTFILPYKPTEKGSHEIATFAAPVASKDLLLVVEDNLINQRLTKRVLERAGYEIITAKNGQEALDLFKGMRDIKLIIMDIQMPVLDGLSATQAIRAFEKENSLSRTPIIALTAHAMKGDKEKCIAAGCDSYLPKPIMIDSLIGTIKTYLPV